MAETLTVVTDRPGMTTERQMNAVVMVGMRPWKIALVRAVRVYLQTLVAAVLATSSGAAAAIGITMPAQDFWHVLLACASIAVAPAVISFLQNAIELLTKLDATSPQLRA